MKLLITLSLLLPVMVCTHLAYAEATQIGVIATDAAAVITAPEDALESPENIAPEATIPEAVIDADTEQSEVQPIYVTDYVDALDIQALENIANTMAKAVRVCIDDEKTNKECLCESKLQVKDYQQALATTLKNHAEWDGRIINYTDPQGVGITITFAGHQRQSDMLDDLECPE